MPENYPSLTAENSGPRRNDKILELQNIEREHMRLLERYRDQIQFIEDHLRAVREERRQFFEEQLPELLHHLRDEDYVDEGALTVWRDLLVEQMTRSFEMSDNLLSRYVITPFEQLQKKFEELCQPGYSPEK